MLKTETKNYAVYPHCNENTYSDINPKIYVGSNMKNYLEEQGYLVKPEKEIYLFDLVEDKTVPIGLSCSCPKCSFR